YGFERDTPGGIHSFGDALWWAVATVSTVGYGDRVPATAGGRGVAVVLMLVGIGLFGLLAASLASFFVEEHAERGADDMAARLERIESLLQQVLERDSGGQEPPPEEG